jgi:hypothetical protein
MALSDNQKDHGRAAVKAIVNAIPIVGGPVASLIDDYIPSWKDRNADEARRVLTERLVELGERIDNSVVKTDEFAELYCKWERVIRETRRQEKIAAACNLLANTLLQKNDSARRTDEELHFLLHCVDVLSIGAINMLGAVRSNRHPANYHNMDSFPVIRKKFPSLDQDMVLGLLSELRGLNLVHVTEGVVSTPDYSHISVKLTPLGDRFATRFIEGKSDAQLP